MNKEQLIEYFKLFSDSNSYGLEKFLSSKGEEIVFKRFLAIETAPINKVQLNQLFVSSGLTGITFGFFKYYWLMVPEKHPYDVKKVEDFDEIFVRSITTTEISVDDETGKETTHEVKKDPTNIASLQHFRWGLRRIFIDALLFFGNITNGYNHLNSKKEDKIKEYFAKKLFPFDVIIARGHSLKFNLISHDERYLIAEKACKSYGTVPKTKSELMDFLSESYDEAVSNGNSEPTFKQLLSLEKDEKGNERKDVKYINAKTRSKNQLMLSFHEFAFSEKLDEKIQSKEKLLESYSDMADKFLDAREKAEENTRLFLSLVYDLDVYVATSMREPKDFKDMATTCERIFKDHQIKDFNLRYFDPTISAAEGHEDKGLIECLMVKCARVLIYTAGINDSYGKDAEAAMALCSGKPVIFYCKDSKRENFFKQVHPLTKLVDFSTGVANGAIVTDETTDVIELIRRIFTNDMEYYLTQEKEGYFRLHEKLTESPIRIQTNDQLLSKSFWNYFDRIVIKED